MHQCPVPFSFLSILFLFVTLLFCLLHLFLFTLSFPFQFLACPFLPFSNVFPPLLFSLDISFFNFLLLFHSFLSFLPILIFLTCPPSSLACCFHPFLHLSFFIIHFPSSPFISLTPFLSLLIFPPLPLSLPLPSLFLFFLLLSLFSCCSLFFQYFVLCVTDLSCPNPYVFSFSPSLSLPYLSPSVFPRLPLPISTQFLPTLSLDKIVFTSPRLTSPESKPSKVRRPVQ